MYIYIFYTYYIYSIHIIYILYILYIFYTYYIYIHHYRCAICSHWTARNSRNFRHGLGRHAFLQGLQTLADGLLQNLRRNWCSLAFHEPKIKRWHRWHCWHSWHSWQLSTTFHISTDSTEILQGLMQGGLAMSCHVLPSWPLRPVFGTDVLEVAGAPHPSGAPQPMSSMSFLVTWCSHKTSHETLYMYNISGSL